MPLKRRAKWDKGALQPTRQTVDARLAVCHPKKLKDGQILSGFRERLVPREDALRKELAWVCA